MCRKNDHEALKEWIHHLTGSWEIIHAGKPLRELFALLQDSGEFPWTSSGGLYSRYWIKEKK